jgi:hypothetical protein
MSDPEHEVKRIILTAVDECAVCGQEYALESIDVIGHRGNLWMLALQCPNCQKQGFIAALVQDGAVALPLAARDLTEAELARFSRSGPIAARDVLEMRKFLADFDGDLAAYLSDA